MGLDLKKDMHRLQEAWGVVRDAAHAAGKYAFVPSGMNFDGGDVYISAMELIQLRGSTDQFGQRIQGRQDPKVAAPAGLSRVRGEAWSRRP
jgi:hypothetical protein